MAMTEAVRAGARAVMATMIEVAVHGVRTRMTDSVAVRRPLVDGGEGRGMPGQVNKDKGAVGHGEVGNRSTGLVMSAGPHPGPAGAESTAPRTTARAGGTQDAGRRSD